MPPMASHAPTTTRQRWLFVLILGALRGLGPFTVDLYLPAFPQVEADLGIDTAAVQLTLTATALGFALGQLVVGPWSDRVGRRLPIILATTLHIAASLGVALTHDYHVLLLFRALQGAGAAAGAVVAMAMVRDLFAGHRMVRVLARLALVTGLAPILAPVIGSQLMRWTSWRGIFVVLAAFGALVWLCTVLFIPETLPRGRRHAPERGATAARYKILFADRAFVGVALIGGMVFSGLFAYLSSSSFLFQQVYHLDAQDYGLLFAVNSLGIVAGAQASARLAQRIGPQWVLVAATAVLLAASGAIVLLDLAGAGLFGVLVPLWVFLMTCGLAMPCIQVLALAEHGAQAGTAASLLGAVNFGLAGVISPVIGLFGIHDAVPMGATMAATSVVAILSLWILVRPRSVPALAP